MRLLALVTVLFGATAFAQANYVVSSIVQPYVPLSGTGVSVVSAPGGAAPAWVAGGYDYKDEGQAIIPLGFTFPFYGQTFTDVGVHSNGLLVFGTTYQTECGGYTAGQFEINCSFGGSIPSTTRTPHNFIAPWWADHEGNTAGEVRYFRPTPNELVIEYFDWDNYGSNGSFSFQVRLNASGLIQVHYGPKSGSFSGVAGLEDSTGAQGVALFTCAQTGSCSNTDWVVDTLFTIGQPVQPDLVVQSVNLNSTVKSGSDLTVTATPTFRNLGQNDATNFHWKAYLSTDKVLDGTDPLFYDSQPAAAPVTVQGANNTSNPTATATGSGTVLNVANGNYYVLVEADTTGVVTEFTEGNNLGATLTYFTFGIDLVAVGITGPSQTGPGNTVALSLDWFNQGTDPAPTTNNEVEFRVVLSSDKTLDASDFVIDTWTETVLGGTTCSGSTCTHTVTIPQNVPGGDYYFGLVVDPNAQVAEAKTNNVAFAAAATKVFQADLEAVNADLVDANTLQSTRVGFIGETGTMSAKITNIGGADAKNFTVGVVISRDSSLSLLNDTLVADEPVALIPAGATQTVTFNFPIPLTDKNGKAFETGQYFLYVIVDSYSTVTELSESNNTRGVGVNSVEPVQLRTPAADYAVVKLQAPAAAAVGEIVPVFRILKNVGNADGQKVSYRYYASANDIITTDDVALPMLGANGQVEETGEVTLSKGQSDSKTDFVRLPATMSAGAWHLGCIVDVGEVEPEISETNNNVASGSLVQVAPSAMSINNQQLPDATVDVPYAFKLSVAGAQTQVSWSVTGDLPAGLTLDGATGILQGTPTATSVSSFTVMADNGTQAAAARLVLRVLPVTGELFVASAALPPVINSTSATYVADLAAAGGTRPYAWALLAGSLPNGLALSASGTLSGSPKPGVAVGEVPLLFEVTDAVGTRARAQIKLRVVEPGALVITTLSLPDTAVNADYIADFAARNANNAPLAKPLQWSIVAGRLPEGMAFTVAQDELGLLTGKALEAGDFSFSVQVVDGKGRADVTEFTLRVHPGRLKLSAVDAPVLVHPGDEVNFQITTGNAQSRYRLYSGRLPPGLTLNENGAVTGTVEMENSVGTWNYVVEAESAAAGQSLGAFSLEVQAQPAKAGCSASGGSSGAGMIALFAPLAALVLRRRRAAGVLAALAAVALLAVPSTARAQTYTLVGPAQTPYQALVGGTTLNVTSFSGDSLTLPFDFEFYGVKYASVGVSLHGFLAFSGDTSYGYNYGIPHNSSFAPATVIAPWWDEMDKPVGSTVKYKVQRTAPNRELVIEWKDVSCSSWNCTGTQKFSFQVWLYEGSNKVRFAYGTQAPGSGSSASVGIMGAQNVGIAGLTCTSATAGSCGPTSFPIGAALDFAPPADLQIKTVNTDDTGYSGVPFPGSAVIVNNGGLDAQGAAVRFYLSSDAVFDKTTDLQVGDSNAVTVPVRGEALVTAALEFASSVVPGNYFLFAEVDATGAVDEGTKENNNVSVPLGFTVGAPTPDLQILSVSGPNSAQAGDTLNVGRTIVNGGNADVTQPSKVTYFVSDNSVVTVSDIVVATTTLLALAADAGDTKTEAVTLPSTLPAGKYWVGLCVDYDPTATPKSEVVEISEVNNCATGNAFVLNTGTLAVVTTSLPMATQHAPFGLRLEAAGGDGTYAWSLDGGSLPPGVTLTAQGDLGGSPSAAGTFTFSVKVSSGGADQVQNLSLTIQPKDLTFTIVDQDLPTAEFGRGYSVQLVAVGGKAPYIWAIKEGSKLPEGLALSSDGFIEGRAAKADSEPFAFSVIATDGAGTVAARDLALRVILPTSMHIATSRLSVAQLGKSYRHDLQAIGGAAPYLWSVVKFQKLAQNATEVPGGEELGIPDGFGIYLIKSGDQAQLSGTPGQAGLYAVTFRVQDNSGAEDITTLPLQVGYDKALAITTTVLPDAFVGVPYNARLSHNGGDVAVTFSSACVEQATSTANGFTYACVTPDALQQLPAGLLLGPDGSLSGTASALPATAVSAGTDANGNPLPRSTIYSFLVKASDNAGRADVRSLSVKVREAPAVKSGGCSSTGGMAPAALALSALVGVVVRRRRRA